MLQLKEMAVCRSEPHHEKTNNVVFPNRSNTNKSVQTQKMARGWKFSICQIGKKRTCTICSENKGSDQLRSYCEADLRLCFAYAKCLFSHDAAQIIYVNIEDMLKFSVCSRRICKQSYLG